jgi:hypothetical protein
MGAVPGAMGETAHAVPRGASPRCTRYRGMRSGHRGIRAKRTAELRSAPCRTRMADSSGRPSFATAAPFRRHYRRAPRRTNQRRCVVLSAEPKAVHEPQRHYTDGVGGPRPPRPRRRTPLPFNVLWWVSVLTMIFGAVLPGLAMAGAVGLGWLVWRYTAQSGEALGAGPEVADGRYGRVRPERPASGAHHGLPHDRATTRGSGTRHGARPTAAEKGNNDDNRPGASCAALSG